jgi:excisionase family DNA binding protein
MEDSLLAPQELAERLAVKPSTVLRWAKQGRIPAVRPTRRVIRFDVAAVLQALRTPATDEADGQNAGQTVRPSQAVLPAGNAADPPDARPGLPAACQKCLGFPDVCRGCQTGRVRQAAG